MQVRRVHLESKWSLPRLTCEGIIATTLGHDTFKYAMLGPTGVNAGLTGAIVSLYNVGQAIGTFGAGYSANKYSRRWTICASAIIGKAFYSFDTKQY